ncbi:VWA domain-containing protein [Aestuariirhabdus litorea]|uniref:VWA domain-containing protein n=1 Tax=Aestuariirhabdus litorea TaxID=2528527 RepID=A0A3P3VQF4_9GAMM|nr:VWA domain-containing protein [Aestuariirhabdus litorea]
MGGFALIGTVLGSIRWVVVMALLALSGYTAGAMGNDVRMLIDISGSMKANDPDNLRVPAVELMTDLLPDGAKAGVWTFGQEVNMLVPYGTVNELWRKRARERIKQINSVGLYTNIGAVLDKASFDRNDPATDSERNLILLTDGMVDVSKEKAADAEARERILSQQLPELAGRGYRIHTIALSENSDRELMDTLAIDSGGLSSRASSAQDLTTLFLKALEQAEPVEEVPLKDNRFLIDSSVDEFTLLAFKSSPDDRVQLRSPSEAVIDRNQPGEGVRWYAAPGYELITIPQPYEGEWLLQSQERPDNRVTVVSDFKMEVSRLSPNAYVGEQLSLEVGFTESGQPLKDPALLELIALGIELRDGEGEIVSQARAAGSEFVNGIFKHRLPPLPDPGDYELIVLADGQTFKREQRQPLSVREPFLFRANLVTGQGPDRFDVEVVPRTQSIDRGATEVFARVIKPDGTKQLRGVITLDAEARRWSFPIEALVRGEYQINLKVSAVTQEGKPFEVTSPLTLSYPEATLLTAPVAEPGVEIASPEQPTDPEPAQVEELQAEPGLLDEAEKTAESDTDLPPEADTDIPATDSDTQTAEPAEPSSPEGQAEAEEAGQAEEPGEPEEESRLWLYIALALANLLVVVGLVFVYLKFIREPKPAPAPADEEGEDDRDSR